MARRSIVRESKYRHVFAEALKGVYEDVRPSNKPSESVGIRCNGKHIALPWEAGGGGCLAVFGVSKIGRIARDLPLITGHTGAILDFEFCPFDDDMLCSSSEDTTVRIWQIPEDGMKVHMKEEVAKLEGHEKKVSFCTWNPTANNILASAAFDMKTIVWNTEEQAEAFSVKMPEQVWSLKWNYTGSLLASGCKDKKLHLIDPRKQEITTSIKVHEGSKAIKVEWMGRPDSPEDCFKLITTGFSGQAERQISIWDLRKVGGEDPEPLNCLVCDTGTGALMPQYDAGTGLLFAPAKGDANCRYFEMDEKDPYCHFITQYSGMKASKGWDWLPKRCMDTTKHEIMRGMQLQDQTIVPITFKVPRKAENFQEDIYPDCPSGEPSMTAEAWVGGSECQPPKAQSMRPGTTGERKKSEVPKVSLKQQLEEALARIKELEEENAKLKEENAKLKA